VEAEDGAAGGVGVQQVGEAGFNARGLIKEGKRPARSWESLRDALAVLLGLDFTPMRAVPSFLASITPTACPSAKRR
jgi:hypothetical protein